MYKVYLSFFLAKHVEKANTFLVNNDKKKASIEPNNVLDNTVDNTSKHVPLHFPTDLVTVRKLPLVPYSDSNSGDSAISESSKTTEGLFLFVYIYCLCKISDSKNQ